MLPFKDGRERGRIFRHTLSGLLNATHGGPDAAFRIARRQDAGVT